MTIRKKCPACNIREVAVNYTKKGVLHYRTLCDRCARTGKKAKPLLPSWALSGYKKKDHCEKCGFKAKHREQIEVFYLNGNITDANWNNLKSICANCQIEVGKSKAKWRPGLTPDF